MYVCGNLFAATKPQASETFSVKKLKADNCILKEEETDQVGLASREPFTFLANDYWKGCRMIFTQSGMPPAIMCDNATPFHSAWLSRLAQHR